MREDVGEKPILRFLAVFGIPFTSIQEVPSLCIIRIQRDDDTSERSFWVNQLKRRTSVTTSQSKEYSGCKRSIFIL